MKQTFLSHEKLNEIMGSYPTPNSAILEILKDEGCGVDCSSMTELMMAERYKNAKI